MLTIVLVSKKRLVLVDAFLCHLIKDTVRYTKAKGFSKGLEGKKWFTFAHTRILLLLPYHGTRNMEKGTKNRFL